MSRLVSVAEAENAIKSAATEDTKVLLIRSVVTGHRLLLRVYNVELSSGSIPIGDDCDASLEFVIPVTILVISYGCKHDAWQVTLQTLESECAVNATALLLDHSDKVVRTTGRRKLVETRFVIFLKSLRNFNARRIKQVNIECLPGTGSSVFKSSWILVIKMNLLQVVVLVPRHELTRDLGCNVTRQ